MPATMASGWDRVRVWFSGISSAGAHARALDIWLGAVAGVVWGTLLGGVSGAAGFAVAYGVLLRAWRVHRPVLSCAGTTWVLRSAALRVVLCDERVSPVVENDGLVAAVAAFGVVVLLWRTDLLPFGLDWAELPVRRGGAAARSPR